MKSVVTALALLTLTVGCASGGDGPKPERLRCDINGDGQFTFQADYQAFMEAFRGESDNMSADLNGDGLVTTTDWGLLNEECPRP